jgi:polyhydroxyalkanoate synthase subunit PhaC
MPATRLALAASRTPLVGSTDYQEIGLDGGHVGGFVTAKSQDVLREGIADWLRERH